MRIHADPDPQPWTKVSFKMKRIDVSIINIYKLTSVQGSIFYIEN